MSPSKPRGNPARRGRQGEDRCRKDRALSSVKGPVRADPFVHYTTNYTVNGHQERPSALVGEGTGARGPLCALHHQLHCKRPPIAGGLATAMRAGPAAVVAARDADLGLGQFLRTSDADRRVGARFAGSGHGVTPERKVLSENASRDGKVFTDSARFLC